jgi:hypothetical protein
LKIRRIKAKQEVLPKNKRDKKRSGKKHTWLKYMLLLLLFSTALVIFALSPDLTLKK